MDPNYIWADKAEVSPPKLTREMARQAVGELRGLANAMGRKGQTVTSAQLHAILDVVANVIDDGIEGGCRCCWCGHCLEYKEDTHDAVVELMKAHEQQCPKNPLFIDRQKIDLHFGKPLVDAVVARRPA